MRLAVTGTYYKHGNRAEVLVYVVDESQSPAVKRTDLVSAGAVELLAGQAVLQRSTFDRFNGSSEGCTFVIFSNPPLSRGLSARVNVTLTDATALSTLVTVAIEDGIGKDPLNPNSAPNPSPGDTP